MNVSNKMDKDRKRRSIQRFSQDRIKTPPAGITKFWLNEINQAKTLTSFLEDLGLVVLDRFTL